MSNKKTISTAQLEINSPAHDVFDKLTGIGAWNSWRTIFSRLVATGGGPILAEGDVFGTISPLLCGFIPLPVVHTCTKLADGKEVTYTSTTLFGAIKGSRTVRVRKTGGLFGGRSEVTVQQEVGGPASVLIPGSAIERSNVRFLLDLAAATQVKAA